MNGQIYDPSELLALAIAVSFAAGLNVYAVIATLGLLAQAGMVTLPGPIVILANWWVIGASLTLFALEFVADKIPFLDLIWNVLQLAVRVPAAALLAFGTTTNLPPSLQVVAAVSGAVLALASASGKIALRSAATTSPEPISNLLLSLIEDLVAIGLTWFATSYPWLAASIALTLFVSVLLVVRLVWRGVRATLGRARRQGAGLAPPPHGGGTT